MDTATYVAKTMASMIETDPDRKVEFGWAHPRETTLGVSVTKEPLGSNFIAIPHAEAELQKHKSVIRLGGPEDCHFNRHTNRIAVPKREFFKTANGFYISAFHELVHMTGPKLGRDMGSVCIFGGTSIGYCREEVVAELGAQIAAHRLGIQTVWNTLNSAAYIRTWAARIPRAERGCRISEFVRIVQPTAEKAVDMLLGSEGGEA